MKNVTRTFLFLAMILSACNHTVPTRNVASAKEIKDGNPTVNTDSKEENSPANRPQIFNNISLETKGGLEVDRVFLTYENDELVSLPNVTSPKKPVYLNLNVSKGWKEEMGEVSIGASERIVADDGTVCFDNPDLFNKYMSISADDAKFIKLKADVNGKPVLAKGFVVEFKVWDKNGDAVLEGHYQLHVE